VDASIGPESGDRCLNGGGIAQIKPGDKRRHAWESMRESRL
jgi:hypothetical protein